MANDDYDEGNFPGFMRGNDAAEGDAVAVKYLSVEVWLEPLVEEGRQSEVFAEVAVVVEPLVEEGRQSVPPSLFPPPPFPPPPPPPPLFGVFWACHLQGWVSQVKVVQRKL